MEEYEEISNLDLLGINDPNKISYKEIPLYIKYVMMK